MAGLPDLTSVYKVESGGQSLDRGAWMTRNPRVVLSPPSKRGGPLTVPRAGGAIPLQRKLGTVVDSLLLVFVGDVDKDGVAAANPRKQLLENLHWFDANIYQHSGVTATVKVTGPGGFVRQGNWELTGFSWGDAESAGGLTTCRATLRFEIPQRLT